MGNPRCDGDHAFTTQDLGTGMQRMECARCGNVIVELDAAEEGALVSVPGLFRPSRPTLFSVLGEERRSAQAEQDSRAEQQVGSGPRHAFDPLAAR